MSPYEYLTVFLSVIFGLAIVHLLSGVSLILDARERSRPYWVHLVWTLNVFVLAVVTWWFNFSLEAIREWSFLHFADLVFYAVLIYVLAGLLYPTRGPEVVDFRAHFERNRQWFFTVFAIFVPVDVFNSLLEVTAGLEGYFGQVYFFFMGASLLGAVAAARTRNALFHGLFGIGWLVSLLAWVGLEYAVLSEVAP